MDLEVTVTLANMAEVQAKLGEIIEDTRRKIASGEIEPGADQPGTDAPSRDDSSGRSPK